MRRPFHFETRPRTLCARRAAGRRSEIHTTAEAARDPDLVFLRPTSSEEGPMRDEHRPKQELINEVVGLRKQVADLKEAAVARRRVEEALRASEEHYRALVEQAPAGIGRVGRSGEFVTVNSAFAAMLGYASRSEALEIAKLSGLFADEEERKRVMALLGGAAATGVEHVRLRRADGTAATLHLRARIADLSTTMDYIVVVEPVAE
jgi:PAS domain S-box-containing protein